MNLNQADMFADRLPEMDAETLVRLAIDVRALESAYFRNRSPQALVVSKAAEQRFDRAAIHWLARQPAIPSGGAA